jgi:hypothetical protein
MLLVDDDERQCAELHVFLQERMRPYHEVDVSPGDRWQECPAFRCADLSRQQLHPMRAGGQPRRDGSQVLLREDFGGRHQGDLKSVLHRDQRGEQRDDGLAGTDVSLQQAVHRPRLLHVGNDLAQRTLLPLRQLEGQHPPGRLTDRMGDDAHAGLADLRILVTPEREARLEEEEFLEDQAALGRRPERVQLVDGGDRRRKVRLPERGRATGPAFPPQDVCGTGSNRSLGTP